MLTKCPECSADLSDKAMRCPKCGYPMLGTKVISAAKSSVYSAKGRIASGTQSFFRRLQRFWLHTKKALLCLVRIAILLTGLTFLVIYHSAIQEYITLLFEDSSYPRPSTILGYSLGGVIEDPSSIIKTNLAPNVMPTKLAGGGSFEVRCNEDFFGLHFETCSVSIGPDGISTITAYSSPIEHLDFKRAMRRARKCFGKPTYSDNNFCTWLNSGIMLKVMYDPNHKNNKEVVLLCWPQMNL